jgi:hypothetical protein
MGAIAEAFDLRTAFAGVAGIAVLLAFLMRYAPQQTR